MIRAYAVALAAALLLSATASAEQNQACYLVKYSGGSLPTTAPGQDLCLYLDQPLNQPPAVRLQASDLTVLTLPVAAITEVSYGQEVHRRVGTAVATAVLSLGVGLLVALSKSKKHYLGIVWDDAGKKGGLVLQADKNEYRGLIAGLEGLTGKKAVNTDPPEK